MSMDTAAEIELIKQLKYDYIRALDNHDWDAYGRCFTADATSGFSSEATQAQLSLEGRDQIVSGISMAMDRPFKLSVHQVHHPQIELVGGHGARGRWYLQDMVLCEAENWILNGAAYYADEYRKENGAWLICHTGYERHFEFVSELPSGFRMTTVSSALSAAMERAATESDG